MHQDILDADETFHEAKVAYRKVIVDTQRSCIHSQIADSSDHHKSARICMTCGLSEVGHISVLLPVSPAYPLLRWPTIAADAYLKMRRGPVITMEDEGRTLQQIHDGWTP